MCNRLLDFFLSNASAVFALGGALIGAFAAFITSWIMSQRELRLKLREKILDRRIQAHEKVIELSHSFRTMMALGGTEENGELARTPVILSSEEKFNSWFLYFHNVISETSSWLRNDLTREINLFQDYLVNLNEFLGLVPPENFSRVGQVIRLDFINFSGVIEKTAFQFFSEDLEKLRLNNLKEWHKYPVQETHRRLEETDFWKRRKELNELLRKSN